jgi:hypothetical protein
VGIEGWANIDQPTEPEGREGRAVELSPWIMVMVLPTLPYFSPLSWRITKRGGGRKREG